MRDIRADEFILEFVKVLSPAPPDWKPENFEIIKTQDEPYFKVGQLEEGRTYAFRRRAKNSAGYGGYSEVWIVKVV